MNNRTEYFSKEEVEEALSKCSSIGKAAELLGISRRKISYFMGLYGLRKKDAKPITEKSSHSEIDKEWLIEHWVNTSKSLETLAKEYGVTSSLLEYRTNKYGLTKSHKYKINRERLLSKSDANVAYLAGLVATDGYVNTNADFVSISMCGDSEKRLMEDILRYFESDAPISEYTSKGIKKNSIRISCTGIKEFLNDNFGVTSKDKTITLSTPSNFASEDCAKAYVLGCMDGDGCISHIDKSPTVALLTASEDFVIGLKDIIEKYSGCLVHYYDKKPYFSIAIGGRKNVVKFLDWMYSTSSCLRLGRKYEKYIRVKDIV